MKQKVFSHLFFAALAVFTVSLTTSCGAKKTTSNSEDSPSSGDSASAYDNTFSIKATFPIIVDSTLHKKSSTDWSQACSILPTNLKYPTSSASFIDCTLEVQELDLYVNKFDISFNAPSGACDYVVVNPYWFWKYPASVGPSAVSVAINSDTSTASLTSQTAGNALAPAGLASVDNTGKVSCQYDYTSFGGPNCCQGSYQKTITTTTGGVTGAPVTTTETWNGLVGNCAAGVGLDYTDIRSSANTPGGIINYSSTGIIGKVAVKSQMDAKFGNVFYAANYASDTSTVNPLSKIVYTGSSAFSGVSPRAYYEFACMNHALETKGRIRLQIRKWSLASEMAKGPAGTSTVSGSEGDPGSPNSDKADFFGWEDYPSYPGSGM